MAVTQLRTKLFRGATLALATAAFILWTGSTVSAQAATVPFTFDITYDTLASTFPSPGNLTITGYSIGSGTFAPFGNADYSAAGPVTFGVLPSGDLFPSTVNLTFTASFHGGADTFTGTDVHLHDNLGNLISENITILSGTGIFSGATGSASPTTIQAGPSGNTAPGYLGTLNVSGSGQITAPGLNAVPEPATMGLLSTSLVSLAGFAAIRKRRQS